MATIEAMRHRAALAEQGYTMNLSHTAQTGIILKKIEGFNVTFKRMEYFWRHFDMDGRDVGPCYPTKVEALADTNDYVKRAGWLV